MRVRILSHRDVLAALSPAACADAMAAVLAEHARGGSYLPLRSVMAAPQAAGLMGLMPGWRGPQPGAAAAFGLKAVCIIPGNPARGLDAHQGLVTLFDGETGTPTAILNAAALTEIRTAAVTSVATRALARHAGPRPSAGADTGRPVRGGTALLSPPGPRPRAGRVRGEPGPRGAGG